MIAEGGVVEASLASISRHHNSQLALTYLHQTSPFNDKVIDITMDIATASMCDDVLSTSRTDAAASNAEGGSPVSLTC